MRNELREAAAVPRGDVVKKLKGFKQLWRYRIRDYRIVYEVDGGTVTLLMAGDRKEVYKRVGYIPQEGPTSEVVAENPELVEPEPTPRERYEAIDAVRTPPKEIKEALPCELTPIILEGCAIPREFWSKFGRCRTGDDLLLLDVPDKYKDKVIEALFPKRLPEVLNDPIRVTENDSELEEFAEGKRDLKSFLLKLDPEQGKFLGRFREANGRGPWIVKGGPGSGKSTVALHCIRECCKSHAEELRLGNREKPRILLTTFTNSLIAGSKNLMESLLHDLPEYRGQVDIKTVNSIAASVVARSSNENIIQSNKECLEILEEAIKTAPIEGKRVWKEADKYFIDEEIEWLIFGRGIFKLEDYNKPDLRKGRGKRLGSLQREQLWSIYSEFRKKLNERSLVTYDQIVLRAYDFLRNNHHHFQRYDYVFIDEAQDLKPTAIQMCIQLAKDPMRVFITADTNQVCYGKYISWVSISEHLGSRTPVILKHNHRSTVEIAKAIREIAVDIPDLDDEVLSQNGNLRGPSPVLKDFDSTQTEAATIIQFIKKSLKDLNLGLSSAAILCHTNNDVKEISDLLASSLRAKKMTTRNMDLDYSGVKVMTIHAAKGMQFPVVVVARLNGEFPRKFIKPEINEEVQAKDRRLFFVACSRAMRRLMVSYPRGDTSIFLDGLSSEHWDRDD